MVEHLRLFEGLAKEKCFPYGEKRLKLLEWQFEK